MEKKQDYMDRFETSNTQITNDIEDLLEFHPELLDRLSKDDREALRSFFFAGRDIDVESVADYQSKLEQSQPGISAQARAAYLRLKELSKML